MEVKPGGPIVLTTSAAEFQILPSGYIQAALLKGDQRLTLDQPGAGGSDVLVLDGKPVLFTLNLGAAKVEDSVGKLGRGKRLEIPAQAAFRLRTSSEPCRSKFMTRFPPCCFRVPHTRTPARRTFTSIASSSSSTNSMPAWRRRMRKPYDMWSYLGRATTGARTIS